MNEKRLGHLDIRGAINRVRAALRKPPAEPKRRTIFEHRFDDGSVVSVAVSGDVGTHDVLLVLHELIRMKKEELATIRQIQRIQRHRRKLVGAYESWGRNGST